MTTELMRDFGIGASQLGNFSAVYFYAYIAMQIPTGVLVDSWGARRLLIAERSPRPWARVCSAPRAATRSPRSDA